MKVVLTSKITDIAKIPEDKKAPLYTDDGAKLVNLTMSGSSVSTCITEAIAAIVAVLDPKVITDDTVMYLHYGMLTTNAYENKFTTIIGVTGVDDLDVKLKEYIESKSTKVEAVETVEESKVDTAEEDAEIVE